jgi:hypothetical protein
MSAIADSVIWAEEILREIESAVADENTIAVACSHARRTQHRDGQTGF